jgi:hypothetical protein
VRRVVFCLLCVPLVAGAGEVLDSQVLEDDGHYHVAISVRIDAPPEVVYQAITDFDNLAAINPSIVESKVLLSISPRKQRVETLVRVCILIFCKDILQVQDVEQVDDSLLMAVTLPGVSDFKSSTARWQLTGQGGATVLRFTQDFEPDFWVPAVIGPWLIERTLVKEVLETAMYIERRPHAYVRQD